MAIDFTITTQDLGKKFNREWIFRGLNLELRSGESYAVTGNNGSGKSTLLKIISGLSPQSKGTISYRKNGIDIPVNDVFQHISCCTPYLELIEELTLTEFLKFHFKFKPLSGASSVNSLVDIMGLGRSANKRIADFSSGMKQRVRLSTAFYSDTPAILLDEPTMNLDQAGINWYLEQIKLTSSQKLLLICSNQMDEYKFCNHEVDINQYKKR